MKKKPLILMTILITILAITGVAIYIADSDDTFRCNGYFVSRRTSDNEGNLELKIMLFLFLNKEGNSYMLQKGEVKSQERIYVIDREVNLSYRNLDNNGTYTVKLVNIKKRKDDNAPDLVSNVFPLLNEHQSLYYMNVKTINKKAYLAKELSIPFFLCSKF